MESPRESELASREAHLRDYWKILWQARWTILGIFLLVVGVTAVWSFLQTPIYRATATIEVQPQANRLAAGQDISGLGVAGYGWFAEEKYHNTQVEIIQSRDVAERVVLALNLGKHELLAGASDPIEAFRGMVRAVPRRDTGLIEITMTGPNADDITQWVNRVAQVYVERNLEKATDRVSSAVHTIKDQMKDLQDEFSVAEKDRFDALKASNVLGSEDQREIVGEKLKTYNAQLTTLQIELNRLRDTLGRIRSMQENDGDLMAIPELAEDPVLKEYYRDKVELEQKLESAKVELRPGHPTYEKNVKELAKLQQRIQEQVSVLLGKIQTKFDLDREHEEYLRHKIEQAEDDTLNVAQASSGYEVVKTRSETVKRILDQIDKTMNEVNLGAQLMTNNVSVLDNAVPPRFPIKPAKRMNLTIGAVMGLFLGLAAAFFLDYLDNTFRTPDDVEKYLGLSVLGVIPRASEQGLTNRTIRESYQSLRTSVIFSSKNHRRKIILITSTGPQEGKSSTVANLGRTLAAAGDSVIILDCDLRRPTQHVHHAVERDFGVTNYLAAPTERTDWTPFCKTVTPPSLQIMTSGPIPPNPPELLGSERFAALLGALKERFDWVLVDSPPATSLADATQLAALADMIVLVVRHNRTDRDVALKTLQRLRGVNPTVAGAVLNNVDIDRAYSKDYYYAGYYYYESEKADKAAKKKRDREEPKIKVG